jgi:hypothetical protein
MLFVMRRCYDDEPETNRCWDVGSSRELSVEVIIVLDAKDLLIIVRSQF